MPIDSIAQAAHSSVFNTFIVVGGIVITGVLTITLSIERIFIHRSCMRYIPKPYLPLTELDLPDKSSRNMVWKYLRLNSKLGLWFDIPAEKIVHDGLSPPPSYSKAYIEKSLAMDPSSLNIATFDMNGKFIKRSKNNKQSNQYAHEKTSEINYNDAEDSDEDDDLPPNLNYEQVIKTIFDKLKYQGTIFNCFDFKDMSVPIGGTFPEFIEIIKSYNGIRYHLARYRNGSTGEIYEHDFDDDDVDDDGNRSSSMFFDFIDYNQYINLYNRIRFGNKPISKEQFETFMTLTIELITRQKNLMKNDLTSTLPSSYRSSHIYNKNTSSRNSTSQSLITVTRMNSTNTVIQKIPTVKSHYSFDSVVRN
ncbi:uncharacterized protein SCODWIG_00757 [Saccharomycodes ludwigii]|uniref:Defect at low temperature protein 1 n=1 Tax=Saccharomycodes ludwigii TaxID=36035 RepID=A0A376B2T4_9ASCO|nr:hypothetical protein SCDLUD_002419 [Saccharomycodes ludwigii]KAH3900957.1 hypothetical protein SCDLUD_002419 [Saccharomycodes ludwigii]SSD58996.1 uncharacterized protein SCODWIG_00757 [Saccharomycodes ludwigii]